LSGTAVPDLMVVK